jgi:hypothetical protein
MIVDDDRIAEQNTGDYFPWWLNDLVTAIFDPLPTLDQLKQMKAQWTHATSQRINRRTCFPGGNCAKEYRTESSGGSRFGGHNQRCWKSV